MRIAEVAEFYSPTGGGVRSYIDRKFQAATARGHELFVIAPAAEDRFEPRSSGGVVWVRSPPMPMDANYRMFWRADPVFSRLSELEPDVVEASSPWRGAWIAAAWPGPAPRTLFMHADPVATYPQRWLSPLVGPDRVDRLCSPYWAYLRRLSRRFHQVVAGGEWLAERLAANGIGNLRLISLGVERDVFSPARRDESLRRELLAACSLPASATLLLGVGRFHPEKRWPTVIEAVRRANRVAPMGLVLVGDGLDRANVLRAAGGDPRIHFRAPIRDRALMATLMASADALVHGGESETFGLAVAEAAASGAPLVVPDRGGCARLAHPASSETYRSGDVAEATAALLRLHARGPAALRTAAVRLASQARADTRHYAELFAEYEALSHPVAALAAACA